MFIIFDLRHCRNPLMSVKDNDTIYHLKLRSRNVMRALFAWLIFIAHVISSIFYDTYRQSDSILSKI